MPKVRIGLSLSEDVAEILNRLGRSDAPLACPACRYKIVPGWLTSTEKCPECDGTGQRSDPRPTRTELIEQAVRQVYGANGGAVERTTARPHTRQPDSPDGKLICMVCQKPISLDAASEYSPNVHAECQPYPALADGVPDPSAEQAAREARANRKAARSERKGKLHGAIKKALPPAQEPGSLGDSIINTIGKVSADTLK